MLDGIRHEFNCLIYKDESRSIINHSKSYNAAVDAIRKFLEDIQSNTTATFIVSELCIDTTKHDWQKKDLAKIITDGIQELSLRNQLLKSVITDKLPLKEHILCYEALKFIVENHHEDTENKKKLEETTFKYLLMQNERRVYDLIHYLHGLNIAADVWISEMRIEPANISYKIKVLKSLTDPLQEFSAFNQLTQLLGITSYPANAPDKQNYIIKSALKFLVENKHIKSEETIKIEEACFQYATIYKYKCKRKELSLLAIQTGIYRLVEELCIFFGKDDQIIDDVIIETIKSGCEKIIAFIDKICLNSYFSIVNQHYKTWIQTKILFIEEDTIDKRNLLKGYAILEKMIEKKEKNELFQAIYGEGHFCNTGNNEQTNISTIEDLLKTVNRKYTNKIINFAVKIKAKINVINLLIQQLKDAIEIPALSSESIKYLIIGNFVDDENIQIILNLPIQLLLKNELIELLYFNFPDKQLILDWVLAKDRDSLITPDNRVSIVGLLLAIESKENQLLIIDTPKGSDFISIILLAASYPDTRLNKETALELLNNLDKKTHALTDCHLILANKLYDKSIMQTLQNEFHLHKAPLSMDDVKYIQGLTRLSNRTKNLYPDMFKIDRPASFWFFDKPKHRMQLLEKNKELLYFAFKYTESHLIEHVSGVSLYLPAKLTSHYINQKCNLESILKVSSLYSQKMRTSLGITNMPSMINPKDLKIMDNMLVCTGPLGVIQSNHLYAKIEINLAKLPWYYLKNAIIKSTDYMAMDLDFIAKFKLPVTPDITLQFENKNTSCFESHYSFLYKQNQTELTYTLTLTGENGIFHGIQGFKESVFQIFYIINALPETGDGQIIKIKILEHFQLLDNENKFIPYMQELFSLSMLWMEIDFQQQLPLSLDYIESFQFIKNSATLNVEELRNTLTKGDIGKLIGFMDNFKTLFNQPFLISELLRLVPACYYYLVSSLIADKYPENYISCTSNLIELSQKNYFELKEFANSLSYNPSPITTPTYNLGALLRLLKIVLSKENNKEIRQKLIEKHKQEIKILNREVYWLYRDIEFAGNNSKIRELFINAGIMQQLTGKNQGVIAAILALEIESIIQKREYCPKTMVTTAISKQSNKTITYTLGSILEQGLEQPAFFIEACPINRKYNEYDSAENELRRYIQQKTFANTIRQRLEKSLIDLCDTYSPETNLDNYLVEKNTIHSTYNAMEWEQYFEKFQQIVPYINRDDFCKNSSIIEECNLGLHALLQRLYTDNAVLEKGFIRLPDVKLAQLVDDFLNSTSILNPIIAHLLFDTLHFGVAITRVDEILLIQLQDKSINFYELIRLTMEKIVREGVKTNPLMAEQLALRVRLLNFWCIDNCIEITSSLENISKQNTI